MFSFTLCSDRRQGGGQEDCGPTSRVARGKPSLIPPSGCRLFRGAARSHAPSLCVTRLIDADTYRLADQGA